MLKSYKELTTRYLKANKKRSLFTLTGISLSMMLITSICIFIPSVQKVAADKIRNSNGDWHLRYDEVSKDVRDRIKGNPKTEKVVETKEDVTIPIKNGEITLVYFNGDLQSGRAVNLSEGRFPENEGEVVIDDWTAKRFNREISIGDNILFSDKKLNKNKELKVTGFLKGDSLINKSEAYSKKNLNNENQCSIFVKFKENKDLQQTIIEFKELIKDEKLISANGQLLEILGVSDVVNVPLILRLIGCFVIIIVVIATIAIIYNAFNISIVKRTKELGILRTLGATPKQIKKIVKKEAMLLGAVGIPIGLLMGLISLKIILLVANTMTKGIRGLIGNIELSMVISYESLLLSCFIGIVTIYLSVIFPARLASKTSPLASISSGRFMKKENIKKTKGFIAKKVLKIDALMAYKNIKRNRKSYRITVFSMVISIVLVITFSVVINTIKRLEAMPNNISRDIGIIAYLNEKSEKDYQSLLNYIKDLRGIKKTYKSYENPNYSIVLPEEKFNKSFLTIVGKDEVYKYKGNNVKIAGASIEVYDKEKIEECRESLIKGNIDFSAMEREDGILVINKNTWREGGKKHIDEGTYINVGDEINFNLQGKISKVMKKVSEKGAQQILRYIDEENSIDIKDSELFKTKVIGVLEEAPFDTNNKGVDIIMTKKTLDKINMSVKKARKDEDKDNIIDAHRNSIEIILEDNSKADEITSKIDKFILDNKINVGCVNLIKKNANDKNTMLQINVLLYGFATVIALIGAVNIINTINTNISLRTKEIASLISIGMPMKKIRRMILLEGVFYSIISVIWGCILSMVVSFVLVKIISGYVVIGEIIPWGVMGVVLIIAIVIGIISTLPGIANIKKINVIEILKTDS